jgi:hypothetical protein
MTGAAAGTTDGQTIVTIAAVALATGSMMMIEAVETIDDLVQLTDLHTNNSDLDSTATTTDPTVNSPIIRTIYPALLHSVASHP